MAAMTPYYFEQPDDTRLIVLWKGGRSTEIAHFDLSEARALQRSLNAAIEQLERLEPDEC